MDEPNRGARAPGPEVRFTVRVEAMGPHSHVRTFANGCLAGTLIMRHEEAAAYAVRLVGIPCPVCRGGPLLGGCERCHGTGKVMPEPAGASEALTTVAPGSEAERCETCGAHLLELAR